MTSPAHPHAAPGRDHAHGHGHLHEHRHADDDGDGLAELLDLDALVFADLLAEAVDVAVSLAPEPTRTVVDLGAGTGTGTHALARAFPQAEVVAVDADDTMLERLRARLEGSGVEGRVRTVEADLDSGWPDLGTTGSSASGGGTAAVGGADVVWAAASLHHVADPARVLRDVRDALVPGGLLVVVEMTATSPVLPDDVAHPGLAAHLERALAQAGWNRYPDWSSYLTDAGLDLVERREPAAVVPPGPDATRWAHATASRQREHLADHLDPDDLAALDAVLAATAPADPADPAGEPAEHTVGARGGRIVWAARRPPR
jgi:SAM-dependent methyltransferase